MRLLKQKNSKTSLMPRFSCKLEALMLSRLTADESLAALVDKPKHAKRHVFSTQSC